MPTTPAASLRHYLRTAALACSLAAALPLDAPAQPAPNARPQGFIIQAGTARDIGNQTWSVGMEEFVEGARFARAHSCH